MNASRLRWVVICVVITFFVFSTSDPGYSQFSDFLDKAKKAASDAVKMPSGDTRRGTTAATPAPPAQASEEKERDYSGIEKLTQTMGVGIALGGTLLCGKSNLSQNAKAICVLSAIAAPVVASKVLGPSIVKLLKERDQRKALEAARDALKTGEPQTIELPDSNAVVSVKPVDQPVYKEIESEILADKKNISGVQKLKGIGSVYRAEQTVTVYGGPGASYPSVDAVKAGEKVHVMGKLLDQPWFLVARMVAEGKDAYPAPMAFGFVQDKSLAELTQAMPDSSQKPPASMETLKVVAVLKCQSNIIKVVKDDGQISEEGTTLQCLGIDGMPTSI